jgi:hypothetical protein
VPFEGLGIGVAVDDLGCLVSGKIVEHHVDVEASGHGLVDIFEKRQHVKRGVALAALGDDVT